MKILIALLLFLTFQAIAANGFELAETSRVNGAHELAFKLYLTEAENGHAVSSHWVATYFLDGIGTNQDQEKAIKYFTFAAENGVEGSMIYLLNIHLAKGDCEKAGYWINRAFENEIPKAWKSKMKSCA